MTYKIRFRRAARADYLETIDFYLDESEPVAGRFVEEFENAVNSIRENPLKYQVLDERRGIRRAFIPRFPYGVFFQLDGDVVLVLAVMHLARHPRNWKTRE